MRLKENPETNREIVKKINLLGNFLAQRDCPSLHSANLMKLVQQPQLDALILFGGSILAGAEVFHQAIVDKVAKHYLIVGGRGPTTSKLQAKLAEDYQLTFAGEPSEAEMLQKFLAEQYGDQVDFLETRSTNSGNNVTNSLALFDSFHLKIGTLGIIQDGTMQKRILAGFNKEAPQITLVSYAAYQAEVTLKNQELVFTKDILGMWRMPEYLDLLMGEIPRLRDDANGYGPKGKAYIAHVDIPDEVLEAYAYLAKHLGIKERVANEAYKNELT